MSYRVSYQDRNVRSYQDGPTLLAEQVERDLDLRVSTETVQAWLTGAGLWTRKRKRAKHRSRRPRRAARGELIQWDSSVHAWLEDRGPPDLVLIALHDAATSGLLHGRFVERDTGAANRRAIVECLERHGRARAVYVDHASHFGQRCGPEDKPTRTIIGTASEKLGVEVILATRRRPRAGSSGSPLRRHQPADRGPRLHRALQEPLLAGHGPRRGGGRTAPKASGVT